MAHTEESCSKKLATEKSAYVSLSSVIRTANTTLSSSLTAPLQEGWLTKTSKRMHQWRLRWASLRAGLDNEHVLVFYRRRSNGATTTETFSLKDVTNVRAVGDSHYGHSYCFVVEYDRGKSCLVKQIRKVGLQASSEAERDKWVTELSYAIDLASMVGALTGPPSQSPSLMKSAFKVGRRKEPMLNVSTFSDSKATSFSKTASVSSSWVSSKASSGSSNYLTASMGSESNSEEAIAEDCRSL